jgi:hypothetical protein
LPVHSFIMQILLHTALLLSAVASAKSPNQLFNRNADVCPYPRPTETVFTTVTVYPWEQSLQATEGAIIQVPASVAAPSSSSSPRYSKPAGPTVTLIPTVHWSQDIEDLDNIVPTPQGKIYSSANGTNGTAGVLLCIIFSLTQGQTHRVTINLLGQMSPSPNQHAFLTNQVGFHTPIQKDR